MSEINIPIVSSSSQAQQEMTKFIDSVSQGVDRLNNKFQDLGKPVQKTIEMDVAGLDKVNKDMKAVDKSVQDIQKATKKANDYFAQTPAEIKRSLASLRNLRDNTVKYQDGTRKVTGEWRKLTAQIKQAQGALNQMQGKQSGFLGSITAEFTKANVASQLIVGGLNQARRAFTELINTGMRFQMLNLQLEAFTGSAEGAAAAMASFKEIAIKTPFTLEQVAQAGKTMMAFGLDVKTTESSLESLAVVASATGGDLNNMARNLGQISAQGRAYTRDLTQFAMQGIPIWQQLSVVTGKSTAELKDMAKTGAIGFREVDQAMKQLTAEGSAFADVANRMQTTWTGMFQAVATEGQTFASGFMDFATGLDKAMGNIASDTIKGVGVALGLLGQGLDMLGDKIGEIPSLPQILGNANMFAGLANGAANFNANLENTARVVQDISPGLREFLRLPDPVKLAADRMGQLAESSRWTADELDRLRRDNSMGELADKTKAAVAEYEKLQGMFEKEVAQLERIKKGLMERYDYEIKAQEELISKKEQAAESERRMLEEQTATLRREHEAQMADIDERISKSRSLYDNELNVIGQLTPAQRRLNELRRQELQERANNSKLSEKERVSAQAQLDSMDQQVARQQAKNRYDERNKKLQEEKKNLEKQQTAEMEEQEKKVKQRNLEIDAALKAEKNALRDLKDDREEWLQNIKDAADASKKNYESLDLAKRAASDQISIVASLAGEMSELADQAERYAAATSGTKGTKGEGGEGGGDGLNENFTGGPMFGGERAHVNELGKEAFLTASGKLSMINAKPREVWRAPERGTVIPAHLTKQLDIPRGGININKAAAAQTARAASGGGDLSSAIRSMKSSMGNGDRITNNVTIQSANTTQAASDILVQMTKLKRRRYS